MEQTMNVNITPWKPRQTLYYSQGDIGREIAINVRSLDGYEIPAGATVECVGTKPSGFGFTVAGTISGNTVTIVTTEEMTDEYGRFQAELRIKKDNTDIGTANFWMQGEPSPHPDGTIDGQGESIVPEMTLLVERVEAAVNSMHELSVEAVTQNYGTDATATYDDELNKITFGIPRGNLVTYTDPQTDGNIVITKS